MGRMIYQLKKLIEVKLDDSLVQLINASYKRSNSFINKILVVHASTTNFDSIFFYQKYFKQLVYIVIQSKLINRIQ